MQVTFGLPSGASLTVLRSACQLPQRYEGGIWSVSLSILIRDQKCSSMPLDMSHDPDTACVCARCWELVEGPGQSQESITFLNLNSSITISLQSCQLSYFFPQLLPCFCPTLSYSFNFNKCFLEIRWPTWPVFVIYHCHILPILSFRKVSHLYIFKNDNHTWYTVYSMAKMLCFPAPVEIYGMSDPNCCVYLLHSLALA